MQNKFKKIIEIPFKAFQLFGFMIIAVSGFIILGSYFGCEKISEWIKYKYLILTKQDGGKDWHFINEYDLFDTYSITKNIPWHEEYRWFYGGTYVECYEARKNYFKESDAKSKKDKFIASQPVSADNFFNNVEFDDYLTNKHYF